MNAMTLSSKARVAFDALTAADFMTPNPVSIRADATIAEAMTLLVTKGFSAAPVIDAAGRPLGVLSQFDILVHESHRNSCNTPSTSDERTRARDLMTEAVFSVQPETRAAEVVKSLVALNVHRLFVVDPQGLLIGVISALDVLQHLCPEHVERRYDSVSTL